MSEPVSDISQLIALEDGLFMDPTCCKIISDIISDKFQSCFAPSESPPYAIHGSPIPELAAMRPLYEKITLLCDRICCGLSGVYPTLKKDHWPNRLSKYIRKDHLRLVVRNIYSLADQLEELWENLEYRVLNPSKMVVRRSAQVELEKLEKRYQKLSSSWTRLERFWEVLSCGHRIAVQRARVNGGCARKWPEIYLDALHRAQRLCLLRYENSDDSLDLVSGITKVMYPDPRPSKGTRLLRAVMYQWVPQRYDRVQMRSSKRVKLGGSAIYESLNKYGRIRLCDRIGKSYDDGLALDPDPDPESYRNSWEDDAEALFMALAQLDPTPAISRRIKVGFRLAHAVFSTHYWHEQRKSRSIVLRCGIPDDPNRRPRFAVPLFRRIFCVELDPKYKAGRMCSWPLEGLSPPPFDLVGDTYLLGVSLLEIGLWEPFMISDTDQVSEPRTQDPPHPPHVKAPYERLVTGPDGLETLKNMVRGRLVAQTGAVYAAVAMWCLTRAENAQFRKRYAKMDWDYHPGRFSAKTAMVEFIENVLIPLSSVSM